VRDNPGRELFPKNLFSLSTNVSVHYPIQQGSYTIEQTVALPKEVPKGGSTPLFVSELH